MTREIEQRLAAYEKARKAMKRIDKAAVRTFHDWMIVGGGMRDAQEEAYAVPGIGNRGDTLAFRREFGEILRREKLHEENGGPDKMTRSFLWNMKWKELLGTPRYCLESSVKRLAAL